MPKPTASVEFERLWAQLVAREGRVAAALAKRESEFLKKKYVIGYGVGKKNGKLVATFCVSRKVPRSRLLPKDRLPRSIRVGRKSVPTDVIAVKPSLANIGDPTDNLHSYRVNGKGTWKMGTAINTFNPPDWAASLPQLGVSGTSGALVKNPVAPGAQPDPTRYLLSCAHVLIIEKMDVVQYEQDREKPPGKLNNFVGAVTKAMDINVVDAGKAEADGADKEVLNIGVPRGPQTPVTGLLVQKSGRTTGVTYGKISNTGITLKWKDPATAKDQTRTNIFFIENACKQDPAAPGKLKAGVPADRFGWDGDSGSLIMVGKPGEAGKYGDAEVQKKYDKANDTEQSKIRETWDRAALGLLIGKSEPDAQNPNVAKLVLGQDIQLALTNLNVLLDV
jgi:hypothetical protein